MYTCVYRTTDEDLKLHIYKNMTAYKNPLCASIDVYNTFLVLWKVCM